MFGLLNPWMLWGLLGLMLPLLAHWLQRGAARQVGFSAVFLLKQAAEDGAKRSRLKRWWILLIRALALILIVLGFAQPWWQPAGSDRLSESDLNRAFEDGLLAKTRMLKSEDASFGGGGDSSGGGRVVWVVMDVSASMSRQVNGRTLMERAKGVGQELLDQLEPGVDVCQVVLCQQVPRRVFDQPAKNLTVVQQQLQQVRAVAERGVLADAVELVLADWQALQGRPSSRQSSRQDAANPAGLLVVISDFQVSALVGLDDVLGAEQAFDDRLAVRLIGVNEVDPVVRKTRLGEAPGDAEALGGGVFSLAGDASGGGDGSGVSSGGGGVFLDQVRVEQGWVVGQLVNRQDHAVRWSIGLWAADVGDQGRAYKLGAKQVQVPAGGQVSVAMALPDWFVALAQERGEAGVWAVAMGVDRGLMEESDAAFGQVTGIAADDVRVVAWRARQAQKVVVVPMNQACVSEAKAIGLALNPFVFKGESQTAGSPSTIEPKRVMAAGGSGFDVVMLPVGSSADSVQRVAGEDGVVVMVGRDVNAVANAAGRAVADGGGTGVDGGTAELDAAWQAWVQAGGCLVDWPLAGVGGDAGQRAGAAALPADELVMVMSEKLGRKVLGVGAGGVDVGGGGQVMGVVANSQVNEKVFGDGFFALNQGENAQARSLLWDQHGRVLAKQVRIGKGKAAGAVVRFALAPKALMNGPWLLPLMQQTTTELFSLRDQSQSMRRAVGQNVALVGPESMRRGLGRSLVWQVGGDWQVDGDRAQGEQAGRLEAGAWQSQQVWAKRLGRFLVANWSNQAGSRQTLDQVGGSGGGWHGGGGRGGEGVYVLWPQVETRASGARDGERDSGGIDSHIKPQTVMTTFLDVAESSLDGVLAEEVARWLKGDEAIAQRINGQVASDPSDADSQATKLDSEGLSLDLAAMAIDETGRLKQAEIVWLWPWCMGLAFGLLVFELACVSVLQAKGGGRVQAGVGRLGMGLKSWQKGRGEVGDDG